MGNFIRLLRVGCRSFSLFFVMIGFFYSSQIHASDSPPILEQSNLSGLRVDGYSVSGITVDIPDQSAKMAKEKSILAAYRTGFLALLHEMATRGDSGLDVTGFTAEIAQSISESDLDGLVQDFEIENEKQSAVRYMGTFHVRFNDTAIQRYIQKQLTKKNGNGVQGVTYGAPASNTLIIPVFTKKTTNRLWDDDNQWFHALNNTVPFDDKIFVLPVGDLDDRALFPAPNADAITAISLDPLMDHYGVTRAILAQLILTDDGFDGAQTLNLFYSAKGLGFVHFETLDLAGLPPGGDPFVAAYNLMTKSWNGFLKNGGKGQIHFMPLSVTFDDGDEWRDIQERIRHAPVVKQLSIKAFRMGRADIQLSHMGTESALMVALKNAGFHVTEEKKTKVLSLTKSPGAVQWDQSPPTPKSAVIGLMNHPALKNPI